jgi:PAS domain-containing protein
MQKTGAFEDRFLSKLNKIDKQEVENFLANLVREKHFLQIVFNAMVDGVAVMRPNLEVLYINDAAIDLLGINPRRRIIQESLAGLVPLKEFRELLAKFALNHKRIIREELEVPAPAMRLLHISLIPLEQE